MSIINEKLARDAKRANSFSDYKEGSATSGYKQMLAEFNAGVEKMKERAQILDAEVDEKLELVEYYCNK